LIDFATAETIEWIYHNDRVALYTFFMGDMLLQWACAAAPTELPVESESEEYGLLVHRQAVIKALSDLRADMNAHQHPRGVPPPLFFLMTWTFC
jgi:hypothetical protein